MSSEDFSLKRYIFSGAPGSGKTSVIKIMEQLGHIVVHEAATDVIVQMPKQKELKNRGKSRALLPI